MALVGKITEVGCPSPECGHRFQAFVCESGGWQCKCPKCSRTFGVDQSRSARTRFYGNRRFDGEEAFSVEEELRPWEIGLARKHIKAGKIHDNGRIEFKDRRDEREFKSQLRDLQGRLGAMAEGDDFVRRD